MSSNDIKNATFPKLTNTQGGNVMFSQTDLLFANEFVADTYADVPKDQANSYAKYREAKQEDALKKKQLDIVSKMNDPINPTLPDRQAQYSSRGLPFSPLPPGPGDYVGPRVGTMVERKRKIFIDSKDRDKVAYPDASDFTISWGRAFQNVTRLQLISLEFPNVVPSVENGVNNMLYWQNQEDEDLTPAFPVYSASPPTGSYTLTSLQTELQSDMSMLYRHGGVPYANGVFPPKHYFIVNTNNDTDYVSFTSIIATAAGTNPISTSPGSSTIIFTLANHGYTDNQRIYILGVQGIVGGLQATDINGDYNITVIDENTFSFNIQATAYNAGIGGGFLVTCGREAPFQFLFGNYNDTIADTLGFPVQNSSVVLGQTDPITSIIKPIVGVIPGSVYTQILCPNHMLQEGDSIYLSNFNVSPSIYQNADSAGIFSVHAVPSPDVFLIKYTTESVSDISDAFVGTQIFQMNFPNHGFNRIVDIQQVSTNVVLVTTLFDTGFTNTSRIRISGSDSVPSIDGSYNVTPIDSDSFTISSANILKPLNITTPGYSGILSSDYIFYLYNVTPFGGFTVSDLNSVPFNVRDIIDADNFTFVGNYGYATSVQTGGGANININSKLHGWSGTQDNSPGGSLYKPIRLSGDNYAFMCVPGLNSDSISSTGSVKDIFAKLFLTAVPGVVIFNSFDSFPLDLIKPIARLSELRFTIMTPENLPVSFNGLDYSFSLEVTEMIQLDDNANKMSSPMPPPVSQVPSNNKIVN